ncbi:acetolactate synthase, large subunit, biosynthetic type [Caldisphaera lagunensis DSM 15908]|uniref:Acetolactate synthase n=1 Tax=Caldisphaera lagunensis (strain DSM 15908 / JCM 11604 / ANMR 0165 / IC-154) TaxID=1056495 RepID=U3GK32_CALLD|nr:acetolactate synthase large subunit [Caldisphaera lagunensis]AFZ69939.1 acetolactate synthase, large subunit, biosynthetic type [Caldisphaera lagunensis DSM 15908]
MVNGSRLVVESLKREGVKVIFGIPGLSNMSIYNEFYDEVNSGEIRHILMKHEQAAAHAADGYARALGVPGVCTATSGPGAMNLVTGLITAFWDSSPVVAITGQVPRNSMGKLAFQEADTLGVMENITKFAVRINSINEIPLWIKNAFYISNTGRKGPVVVDIPRDILNENVNEIEFPDKPFVLGYKEFKTEINLEKIKRAIELMIRSERPVIVVGTGVLHSKATKEVLDLAELLMSPIVSTLPAKSAVPNDNPLYIGVMGYYGKTEANRAVLESDLLIIIGSRLSDRTFTSLDEIRDKNLIIINLDPGESMRSGLNSVSLNGDAKIILTHIIKNFVKLPKKNSSWLNKVKEYAEYYSKFYYIEERNYMKPWKILKTIRNEIPRNSIITTGVGEHQMFAEVFWESLEPNTFFTSGGMGTMGFGLPAAIGAKVAMPDRVVVDLDGDGSFLMTGNNLATAVEEKIPIISIIFDNSTLGLVRQVQDLFFNKRIVGVDFKASPDFVKYAKSFGAEGFEANSYQDLSHYLREAMRLEVPSVIRVPINREELALPTLPPGGKLSEVILSDPRKAY